MLNSGSKVIRLWAQFQWLGVQIQALGPSFYDLSCSFYAMENIAVLIAHYKIDGFLTSPTNIYHIHNTFIRLPPNVM